MGFERGGGDGQFSHAGRCAADNGKYGEDEQCEENHELDSEDIAELCIDNKKT